MRARAARSSSVGPEGDGDGLTAGNDDRAGPAIEGADGLGLVAGVLEGEASADGSGAGVSDSDVDGLGDGDDGEASAARADGAASVTTSSEAAKTGKRSIRSTDAARQKQTPSTRMLA
jgi:hypothetical protein